MKRAVAIAVTYLAVAAGLFVFMHTGPRALSACESEGSYRTGTVSFWPLGTECAGPAPPASTIVVFNGAFGVLLLFAAWPLLTGALVGGAALRRRRAA